ncbi:MAG: hypothetical protein WAU13_09500 [Albidovulum sp.]
MGKILAIGAFLIAVAIGLGVDFSRVAKEHPHGAYSLADHMAFRKAAFKASLTGLAGGSSILPPAPAGWTRHAALFEDSLRAYDVEMAPEAIEAGKSLEKSILDGLPGYKRHYLTYENEGKIVVIDVTVVPQSEATRKGRMAIGMMYRRLAGGAQPYMSTADVDLATVKNHMTGKGQLILGQIDGLVYLSVASNADEATTRQLLGAIDFAALHKMVAETKAEAAQLASAAGGTPRVGGLLSGDDCVRKGAGKFCAVGN